MTVTHIYLRRSPGDTTLSEPGDSWVVSIRLARITTIGLQLEEEEEEEIY